MRMLLQNLRYALRQLRQTPGFTVAVIFTLALGIGASTAIYSLVEGILLRPLPFKNADRLVLLGDHLGGGPRTPVTAREIDIYSRATQVFSSLGGYASTAYELSGGAAPEEVSAARLTGGVFPTLGVEPILGRVFTTQEEEAREPLAVIGYALWLNHYNCDPHVLGGSLVLDRKTYAIIGVMPRSFEFPPQADRLDQAQVWVPISLTPDELSDQHAGYWGYHMIGRLKNGVTVSQAALDTDRVAHQIMRTFPAGMSAIHIQGDVTPLLEYIVADVRPLLRTLFFAVAVVLLIASANVSGLLLVRAIRRRREYAIRLVLGARSSHIIRESVFEGLLLSLAGGVLGLAFAATAIRTALYLLPESMPRVGSISTDEHVVTFALLLALATGALCGLAPAFAALRTNLMGGLKGGAQTGTGPSSHSWLRSALVVSEIAVAFVLLTVAGAFLRSFQMMRAVDPGFRPDQVFVAGYQLPLNQYSTNASVDAFNHAVVDRLTSEPGVVAVGITNSLPASDSASGAAYTIEGVPAERWKLKFSNFAIIDGNYFRAMGISLLEGRSFTRDDRASAPLVVVVNQSMARHSWPGQRAIGQRMHVGNPKKGLPWATVVGVVADTKIGSFDEPNTDQWYTPAQQPAMLFGAQVSDTLNHPAGGYVTLRSSMPPEQMAQVLRSNVAEIDPLLALQHMEAMNDVISNVEAPRRFNTDLITAFAIAALLLTTSGIYAMVAFSVSLRTKEIAIRMAIGAQRSGIAMLVLRSGIRLALIGCGLGLLGSLATSRLVKSFLFDVSATDPLFYVGGILIVMLTTLLASALPATRATSTKPADALRSI